METNGYIPTSLQANATGPFFVAVNSPTSCVRPDNVFSVVYIGRDNHIHALQLADGTTSHVDLSGLTGAPGTNRVGPLTHFVRGDGAVLKPGGKLVWIAPPPEGFHPSRTDVQTLRPNVIRDRAHLQRMLALLNAGAVRPPTIARYKLANAGEAHRVSEARHLQGKLVFEVR